MQPRHRRLGHEQRHAYRLCALLDPRPPQPLCSICPHPAACAYADMFSNAAGFNQPFDRWNMSSVTDTSCASPLRPFRSLRSPDSRYHGLMCTCRDVLGRGLVRPANQQLGHEQRHGYQPCDPPAPLQISANPASHTPALFARAGMFRDAASFNKPINSWKMSRVTTTSCASFLSALVTISTSAKPRRAL